MAKSGPSQINQLYAPLSVRLPNWHRSVEGPVKWI